MHRYMSWSGAMPTTGAVATQSVTTAMKTLLQIATPSTRQVQLIAWGFSCDDPPGSDACVELLQTNVAATVTAHVASGIFGLDPNVPTSLMTLGTSASGYNASAEGAITATRVFESISLSSVSGESPLVYRYQWMPDERPIVAVSSFLRVRMIATAGSVDVRAFVVWDE